MTTLSVDTPGSPLANTVAQLRSDLLDNPPDVDFGAFGVIARMNTNFHILKQHFTAKRKRAANDKVRQALRQIAVDAVVAQTLL